MQLNAHVSEKCRSGTPEAAINVHTAGAWSAEYEFINCKTLALRWCLPESWIREQVRSRVTDPIPHVRFGKYVRFRWGSPELADWARRRIVDSNSRQHDDEEELVQ